MSDELDVESVDGSTGPLTAKTGALVLNAD